MMEQGMILAGIMVLVEVIKRVTGEGVKRFLPLISLVIGIGVNLLMTGSSSESMLTGVLLGGAACGLYDFGSKTVLDN